MRWWKRSGGRPRRVTLPPLAPLPDAGDGSDPAVAPAQIAPTSEAAHATPAGPDDGPGCAAADHRPSAKWEGLAQAAQMMAEGAAAARSALAGSAYPIAAYDRFRRDIPIRPPPGPLPSPGVQGLTVLIDGTVAAPFLLRATLRSLQDQSVEDWRAVVVGPASLSDHPVGGFAETDPRITFVAGDAADTGESDVIVLTGGTVLDPAALAWLLFARHRTGAAAIFCDHDEGVADPVLGLVRSDPSLFGAIDPAMLAAGLIPAVVLADAAAARGALGVARLDGGDGVRGALLLAAVPKGVPHVARALGTRLHLPSVARHGRDSADDTVAGKLGPVQAGAPVTPDPPPRPGRIAVVIPTRDAAALLARAIDSLRRTAHDPARIDILVVDNRSGEDATHGLLARLSASGAARIVPFDAPFNWSLASNRGAAESGAPVIVFANNDVEMTSDGWDDHLLEQLADPAVGAVGARLVYPGGTIQHAGVAFGFGPGGAEHEGRDRDAADPGPNRRFVTTHAVSSVTGAFLAVRRTDFDAVGGFDAGRLMIGHSDVDLCLALRERGLTVRYCAAIAAIHHEGATRGRNETRAAIAWDEGERADLIERWGSELGEDVSINPCWTRGGQPFDGLSEPRMTDIVRHLDRTARADPWRPTRRAAQATDAWRADVLR